jgi:hypothetical protein
MGGRTTEEGRKGGARAFAGSVPRSQERVAHQSEAKRPHNPPLSREVTAHALTRARKGRKKKSARHSKQGNALVVLDLTRATG